jgi:hypothetical protein
MKTSIPVFALVAAALAFRATAALVAHWPLDGTAADATGNGHNGTVIGNTVTFGQTGANANTGTAANFSGNGHIDVPWSAALNPGIQAPDGSGSFTVALWARPTIVGGAHRSPFTSREDNGASVNGPIIYIQPSGLWSYWAGNNGPSGAWNPLDAGAATANTWTHVAIVYDADTITRKMYLDGVEVINQPGGVSANVVRNLHIGSGQDDGNNFHWAGQIDDVGFWDHALTEADIQNVMSNGVDSGPIVPDPRLRINSPVVLPLSGGVQEFDLVITNAGLTQNLNITATSFTGSNAASFLVVATPGPIAPGATGILKIRFDSGGAAGDIEASLQITSNDPLDPVRSVLLRGTIHDPHFVSDPLLDFGDLPVNTGPVQASLAIRNTGGLRTLNILDVTTAGAQAAYFTVTGFPATLAPGAAGTIDVTFDRLGADGAFGARLEITCDDALTSVATVFLKADVAFVNPLAAWWPLDSDAFDASGNDHHGTAIGSVVFDLPGANDATGASAHFEGGAHIDVPYSPALNPGISAPAGSGSFTVTLWAYPTAVADGLYHSPFTSREDNLSTVNGPILYATPAGRWEYWAGNNGPSGSWNAFDGGPVVPDTWVHIAITYDADTTTRKMFLDGLEVIHQVVGVSANSLRDLHIGAGQDDGNNFHWTGRIDDVAVFRKALGATEIQQVMTGGAGSLVTNPPATPFDITGVSVSAGQITLTWSSSPGLNYRVQRSTDLTGWQDLDPLVPGAGSSTPFTDTTLPGNTRRVFYRVRVAP